MSDRMHREQEERQAHETALFKAWYCSFHLQVKFFRQLPGGVPCLCSQPFPLQTACSLLWFQGKSLAPQQTQTPEHTDTVLGWAPACRLRWGMLQPSCAPSCGTHGSNSALNWAHIKPELKTEEKEFSVQGAKKDSSTLAPYSCRGDQTQALSFFFSSCILARRVQWGWLIPCWIPGCCRMLTCSARDAALCAGGGSSPFLAPGRGEIAHQP